MSDSDNELAPYELTAGDAAFAVGVWITWPALMAARPGLTLSDEHRLFLTDNSIARDLRQIAGRLSKVAAAIEEQLPVDAPDA